MRSYELPVMGWLPAKRDLNKDAKVRSAVRHIIYNDICYFFPFVKLT